MGALKNHLVLFVYLSDQTVDSVSASGFFLTITFQGTSYLSDLLQRCIAFARSSILALSTLSEPLLSIALR